ncbi:hypothetical protein ABZP36_011205 [Zizania latifolia]
MFDLVISTSGKLVSTLPYPRPSLVSTLADQGFSVETYEDKDNVRKDEISNHLSSQVQTEIFPKFYDMLKEIRDYHRRNPSARFISETDDFEELLKEEPAIEFTGEDCLIPLVGSWWYAWQYREYLEHILEYLTSFLYHTEPLQDIDKIFAKLESEFDEQWANGGVPGWENKDPEKESAPQESVIDLDYYTTVEELVELGPEKLKEALAARGLKSGGTVQQRAERLFLLKTASILPKVHTVVSNNGNSIKDDLKKEIALMEIKMMRLCELLDEIIVRTKENAEKKLTLTYKEMEAEREETRREPSSGLTVAGGSCAVATSSAARGDGVASSPQVARHREAASVCGALRRKPALRSGMDLATDVRKWIWLERAEIDLVDAVGSRRAGLCAGAELGLGVGRRAARRRRRQAGGEGGARDFAPAPS